MEDVYDIITLVMLQTLRKQAERLLAGSDTE